MRPLTAAMMKRPHCKDRRQLLPKEGSKIRELYDIAILGNSFATKDLWNLYILRDTYCMDFVREARGVYRYIG